MFYFVLRNERLEGRIITFLYFEKDGLLQTSKEKLKQLMEHVCANRVTYNTFS